MPKSQAIRSHLPCPDQEVCKSSDAYTEYDDGHGRCFSCDTNFYGETLSMSKNTAVTSKPKNVYSLLDNEPWRGDYRNISSETTDLYGVQRTKLLRNGEPIFDPNTEGEQLVEYRMYPYGNEGRDGFKVRRVTEPVPSKYKFLSSNPPEGGGLWGSSVFKDNPKYATAKKFITITEGEEDTLAVYEMMGDFPVVSVLSSSTAERDCRAEYDWLNSFDYIVLCFDNDEPGQRAVDSVSALFDYNKVRVANLSPYKDASDWLQEGRSKQFVKLWWSAKAKAPDGIISSPDDLISKALESPDTSGITYPWQGMTDLTYGLRTKECVLFTAPEGIGKTEIMGAIEHHILKNYPDIPIGVIHLEENVPRQMQRFAGIELGYPAHLPDSPCTEDQIKESLDKLIGHGNLHVYEHFGSNDPDVIVQRIKFMARVCKCKFIFLDHIGMIVSGSSEELDERRTLDRLATQLASLVQELDIGIIFVSHVNDDGRTRGSRYIAKATNIRFDLQRDADNPDPEIANTTYVVCTKNRFSGGRRLACKLKFSLSTFLFTEIINELPEADEEDKKVLDKISEGKYNSIKKERGKGEDETPTQVPTRLHGEF